MREPTNSSLPYKDKEGICSSYLIEMNNESSLFDYLEPFMFYEEIMVLKTPKSSKCPLQLELLT
jgi:hypothetical protein